MASEPGAAGLGEGQPGADDTMVATSEGHDPSRGDNAKEKENTAEDPRSPGTRSPWQSALGNAAQALGLSGTPGTSEDKKRPGAMPDVPEMLHQLAEMRKALEREKEERRRSDAAAQEFADQLRQAQSAAKHAPEAPTHANMHDTFAKTDANPADDDDARSESSSNYYAMDEKKYGKIEPLSRNEVRQHECDMSQKALKEIVPAIRDLIEQRSEALREIMEISDEMATSEERLEFIESGGEYMHADAWLRKAIRAIIKINAGPKARLFRAAEARLKAKGEALGKESLPYMQMRSGTELYMRFKDFGGLDSSKKVRDHAMHIRDKEYLVTGQSEETLHLALLDMDEDVDKLPSSSPERKAIDLCRLTIEKIPQTIMHTTTKSLRDALADDWEDAERRGKEEPMELQELREHIVPKIAGKKDKNVNVTTRNGETVPCFNCGDLKCTGHAKCTVLGPCGIKGCPCACNPVSNHGNECVMEMRAMPDRSKCKKGDKKPVSASFYKTLSTAHAEYKKKKGNGGHKGNFKGKKSVNTATKTEGSDEEESEGESEEEQAPAPAPLSGAHQRAAHES